MRRIIAWLLVPFIFFGTIIQGYGNAYLAIKFIIGSLFNNVGEDYYRSSMSMWINFWVLLLTGLIFVKLLEKRWPIVLGLYTALTFVAIDVVAQSITNISGTSSKLLTIAGMIAGILLFRAIGGLWLLKFTDEEDNAPYYSRY